MRILSMVLIVVGAVVGFGLTSWTAEPLETPQPFMRAKLVHSQKVLEALTLGDHAALAKHSQAISLITLEEGWKILQTPEYLRRSVELRRTANAITKAARAKNIDGATLAYIQMTVQCVDCHKYIRSVK